MHRRHKTKTEKMDAPDTKRTETAFYESQRLMHDILQGSPIPAFVIGKDHKVIYWNKALEELSGIKTVDIVGTKEHWRAFYQESRPCMADLLVDGAVDLLPRLYSGKFTRSGLINDAYEATDFFPEMRAGAGRWLRFTAAAIKGPQGRIVCAIETLEDITEFKSAEESFRRAEEKYRSIFENAVMGIFQTTPDGRIMNANRAFAHMFGYDSPEEVMSIMTDLRQQLYVYPHCRSEFLQIIEEHGVVQDFEVQFFRKDGSIAWVTVNARAVKDRDGKLLYIEGSNYEITDRKLLESQLRETLKIQAIGTLAGGIAHDFNNILSAILGYTDMALADHKTDDRLRRYLQRIFVAGERARDLVKQILTFSRQTDEEPKPLRVSPVVKEVLKLLRATLPSSISIRQLIQSGPDTILANPTQVHQILMSLCSNAAHAMREGSGELTVSLAPTEIKPGDILVGHHGLIPGAYLQLSVSDTGTGIAPDIINRIFDPFFTTKKPGEGTGMGLSVVHGIVKGYNGTITVESEVGKGSTFSVYMPLLKEIEGGRDTRKETPIAGGRERILFVDDEEAIVELGKDMLSSLGYGVEGSTSSLEALELFRSQTDRFDLVITDMTMPNMTGVELAREIMQIRPDIPVILCTGFNEAITPEKAKAVGMRDFLLKPIIQHQIAAAVRRALDEKD